jgi:hypothetical protein
MPYTAELSRINPTSLIFLIDQSSSMAEPFGTSHSPLFFRSADADGQGGPVWGNKFGQYEQSRNKFKFRSAQTSVQNALVTPVVAKTALGTATAPLFPMPGLAHGPRPLLDRGSVQTDRAQGRDRKGNLYVE